MTRVKMTDVFMFTKQLVDELVKSNLVVWSMQSIHVKVPTDKMNSVQLNLDFNRNYDDNNIYATAVYVQDDADVKSTNTNPGTDVWSRDAFPPISEACVSSFIKSFDFTQMLKWIIANKEECEKRYPRLRDKNAWKSLLHHIETINSMNIVMTDPEELLKADAAWNHGMMTNAGGTRL